MHRSRLVIVIGAGIALLSLPMPLVDLTDEGTINGFEGYGWPAALVCVLMAAAALWGDRAESATLRATIALVAAGGLAVVLAVLKLADAIRAVDTEGGTIELGMWLLLAGCLLCLAGAVLGLSRRL
jgi:uncharacterized membrane protein YccF (DUF307 family)